MVDCGEGTQIQMRRSRLKFSRLGHIFISHLHGDHCFGLIGLISTLGLLGRTADLHIHAPKELKPLLDMQLQTFCTGIDYKVIFHVVDTTFHGIVYEDRSVTIYSIPLQHRIPCCGYLFREKAPLPHIRKDMIDYLHIPLYAIQDIKEGADWITPEGDVISNDRLVYPGEAARSYAYCSDTRYVPQLVSLLQNVDLLFHEATFGNDMQARAVETWHSTAQQAAMIARDCQAKQLLIGHFSARYDNESILLEEAKEVFPNTLLAHENLHLKL
jgi:ribonuclease Z